jgi:hypothetical protein
VCVVRISGKLYSRSWDPLTWELRECCVYKFLKGRIL